MNQKSRREREINEQWRGCNRKIIKDIITKTSPNVVKDINL